MRPAIAWRAAALLAALAASPARAVPEAAPATTAPARPLSLEAFRARLIAALRRIDPARPIATPDAATLRWGTGTAAITIRLDNVFRQHRLDPADPEALIARFLAVIAAPSVPIGEADRARLVVLARPSAMLRELPADARLVARPLGGDLIAVLALDSAQSLTYASPTTLATLGLDETVAFALARRNLAERLGPMETSEVPGIDPPFMLTGAPSGLASGLLADGSRCGAAAPAGMPAGLRVFLHDRGAFVWAVPEPAGAQAALHSFAAWSAAQPDAFSRTVLACRDGQWVAVEQ